MIHDNPGPVWTKETVEGLSQGAELYLVTVYQSDEEEQRAERDGTSQHGLNQQHCPTAQQEDVDKQPEREKHSVIYRVKGKPKQW